MFPTVVYSQNISQGIEPGAEASRFQKEVEQRKENIETKKTKPPKIEVPQEAPKPAPTGEKIYFLLRGVKVTGSTVFGAKDFRPLYAPYQNKKITFAELEEISSKIKALYKKNGYLTTTVIIPSQEINSGVIEIRVIEGKMGSLKIEGNKSFSSELIQKFFHLKKNQIFNINIAQRDMLRLNRNPDLEVRAVIEAGTEPETSDIILKVKDAFPYHAGVSSDNAGTLVTGKNRGSVFAHSSNLTGNFDSIFINSSFSFLTSGQSVSYTLPIGTYGTEFGLDVAYFKMNLGKQYKSFGISGISQIYAPHLSWELYLSDDYQAYANLGIELRSIKKYAQGDITTKDEDRVPYFGFNFTNTDSYGQNSFTPRFSFGTGGFLGASSRNHPSAGREGTGGSFFKYEQGFNRIQGIMWESYLSIRSQFQFASHTLPASEQIQLGGANSIRGYPEGDYLADYGGNVNVDWVFPMYLIPSDWKINGFNRTLRHQIQPVLFADVGGGRLKKVNPGEERQKFLSGIGCGLIMQFNKVYMRLDWAKAVGDSPVGGSGPSTFTFAFQLDI